MHRRRSALGMLVGALLLATEVPCEAQDRTDTLRVEDAVAQALSGNPGLRAARLRADAAVERVSPAGTLPDPGLSIGLMNRSIHGFSSEPAMAMNSLQLSQAMPWPGKLRAAEARSEGLARAAELDARELEAALTARVESLYYRMAYMDRAVAIMERTAGLLRDLHEVASARYAVGSAIQQDVLAAQVAMARLRADIRVVQQGRVAAAARFNALLGLRPDAAVGALALPAPEPVASLTELMDEASSTRPAIQAARERVGAARSALAAAELAHRPDFNVTLGYGQRPQYEDLVTLAVGITLPVRRGSLQEPRRREAVATEAAATADALDVTTETYARLAELRAVAERAAELVDLYRTAVIPQGQAAVEAGLSAYRVGSLDFRAVLQAQTNVNQYEIESVRLAAEHRQALAEIHALIGAPDGGAR